VTIDHPVIGPAVYPGAPYTFSKTPWRIVRRAPLLGEHNLMIYHERLGYSRADIIRFAQAGVI
jgi:crotonobetainyl-CoA:carnitine CoA-transferase CaiB-like acyl-CoA transferase